MATRQKWVLPPPRPSNGLKPVSSARFTYKKLDNGQFTITLLHDLLKGVTPQMLLWWFRHMVGTTRYMGGEYPRYLVWHPYDHILFEVAQPGPDGTAGQRATFHIVEAFGRNPDYLLDRQTGYIIPKGGYQQIREAGLDALRQELVRIEPTWADRLDTLQEWKQVSVLSVESNRLPRWYRPGLLLIGDAAHAMSPVGGVGINYAIQDAVVVANVLGAKLKAGKVSPRDLAEVQRRRIWPMRIMQGFQSIMQQQALGRVLTSEKPLTIPLVLRFFLRLPVARTLPARFIGPGIWPVHVKNR